MARVSEEAVARDREKSRLRAAARRAADRDEYNAQQRKYNANNRDHINEQRQLRYGEDIDRLASREFIAWDGEGSREFIGYADKPPEIGHNYMLFGCSHYPDTPVTGRRLGTKECLEYIFWVEAKHPTAFHVGFAFDYDVNMILRDLPSRFLKHLAVYGVCHWEGYRIQYIPSKMFRVAKGKGDSRVSFTIYDVFGFFHSKYTTALLKFGVTDEQTLASVIEGKEGRGTFTFLELEYVKKYWQDEISFFPPLMDRVRDACYDAGFFITQWHGPGALATYVLRKRGVAEWKSHDIPAEVQIAIQTAYAGGHFQPWRCGLYLHDIYTADLNSAYIYACSLLPRLDNGRFRRESIGNVDRQNIARFGLYHIRYVADKAKTKDNLRRGAFHEIHPLFHRDRNNQVSWPHAVEGWYWSPEAELVKDNPCAEFLEAWIYDDDGTFPFEWVHSEFNKRLALQKVGDPAEKTFKWALAAMYGAFAQLVGWDRKTKSPPFKHELAWAGFITSWCRAQVYKVGFECWRRGGLISIDTDGITSTVPIDPAWLDTGEGEKLGEWKLERHDGILYWQTGFYWLRDDGKWETAKTRGIKRGTLDVSAALEALENSSYTLTHPTHATITKKSTRFVGFREALNHHNLNEWQRWIPWEQKTVMGQGSTYRHLPLFCAKCRNPEVDMLHVLTHFEPIHMESKPHELPWLKEQPSLHPDELQLNLVTDFIQLETDIVDNL